MKNPKPVWLFTLYAVLLALAWSAPAVAQETTAQVELRRRLDLFAGAAGASAETSLSVRPTSLLGVPIDAAVVERMLRARLQDVQNQVLRDVLTGDLAALRNCEPCRDLIVTVAALATQTMDGDARSAAITSATLRVGLSFTLAALPDELDLGPACPAAGGTSTARVVVRANAVYDGLRRSTWMRSLGFPAGAEQPAPVAGCRVFSERVTRMVDTLGRLGSDLRGFQRLVESTGGVTAACRNGPGLQAELAAALRALQPGQAGATSIRSLREIRSAFARTRSELTTDTATSASGTCVQSLQEFQSLFDQLLGQAAADLDQDATLSDLVANVAALTDPAATIFADPAVADVATALSRVRLASTAAGTDRLPATGERLAASAAALPALRTAALRSCLGEVGLRRGGALVGIRSALAEDERAASRGESAAALAGVVSDACSGALSEWRRGLEGPAHALALFQHVAGAPAAPPPALAALHAWLNGAETRRREQLSNDVAIAAEGVRACTSAHGIGALSAPTQAALGAASLDAYTADEVGALRAALRSDLAPGAPLAVCAAQAEALAEALTAIKPGLGASSIAAWRSAAVPAVAMAALAPAFHGGGSIAGMPRTVVDGLLAALPADVQAVRGLAAGIAEKLAALNANPDFALVRDIARRLANRQPLRRGDVIAMAARVQLHLDAHLQALAAGDARWELVKRLVDALLVAVPDALIEDGQAPGGLRFDVASLVSSLTSEFAQQDREGFYVRATIGAGYVIPAGGPPATPFFEEIGLGYRWSALNRRLLIGPHFAASGLLYQVQSIGAYTTPVFVGAGFSVNLYRVLDVSANVGALFDVAPGTHAPDFALTLGLQLPLADYIAALASGTGANTTTTTRAGSSQ